MNYIGSNVKRIRLAKGLKQADLAALLKKPVSYISRFEKGEFLNPTLDTLQRLSQALQEPLPKILGINLNKNNLIKKQNSKHKSLPLFEGDVVHLFKECPSTLTEEISLLITHEKNKIAFRVQGSRYLPTYKNEVWYWIPSSLISQGMISWWMRRASP